jgi:suppressor of G2 allele of SKP1
LGGIGRRVMAEELEKKGNAAFVDEDFEEAVNLYTKALALDSTNASVYISRAAAHVKLENFTDAVADANKAIELNPSLPKAYLRKG